MAQGAPIDLAHQAAEDDSLRIDLINPLDANRLTERLLALDSVLKVEAVPRHDTLLVRAKPGAGSFAEIASIAAREEWPIRGIHRQRARLDGIFRSLTQTDRPI
jgi:hypothetical protein